jgi:starch synthase
VSFLKSGLVNADHLTTVSATYAREITTPQFGCRLEELLQKRAQADQLTGIDETWDPRNCPDLETPFGVGDWQHKRSNANYIRPQFNLALSRGPLFGLVARLVHQKGVDMVLDAAETIVAAAGQIVAMGRGDPHFEHALQQAQARRLESIAVAIRFKDAEARRIFPGSDFTLMPSRFEP